MIPTAIGAEKEVPDKPPLHPEFVVVEVCKS